MSQEQNAFFRQKTVQTRQGSEIRLFKKKLEKTHSLNSKTMPEIGRPMEGSIYTYKN
jgi:hypothetical protein